MSVFSCPMQQYSRGNNTVQANSLKDLLQNKIDDMEKQVLSRVNTLEETKPVSRNDTDQRNRVESTLTSLHHRITDLEKGAFIFSGRKESAGESRTFHSLREFLTRLSVVWLPLSSRASQSLKTRKKKRKPHDYNTLVEPARNAATITLRTDSVREERRAALLCISQDLLAVLLGQVYAFHSNTWEPNWHMSLYAAGNSPAVVGDMETLQGAPGRARALEACSALTQTRARALFVRERGRRRRQWRPSQTEDRKLKSVSHLMRENFKNVKKNQLFGQSSVPMSLSSLRFTLHLNAEKKTLTMYPGSWILNMTV